MREARCAWSTAAASAAALLKSGPLPPQSQKATGIDRPDASSWCTCEVVACGATQSHETRSAKNCGCSASWNEVPTARPSEATRTCGGRRRAEAPRRGDRGQVWMRGARRPSSEPRAQRRARRAREQRSSARGLAHHELPRELQALVGGKRAVAVRVVQKALPALAAALAEVEAQHDEHVLGVALRQRRELARVVERRLRVVHGARAGDEQHAVVVAVQDRADRRAPLGHRGLQLGGGGHVLHEAGRRDHRHDRPDARVVRLAVAVRVLVAARALRGGSHCRAATRVCLMNTRARRKSF